MNQRPLGYEPNELPDCSTPLFDYSNGRLKGQMAANASQKVDSRAQSPCTWNSLRLASCVSSVRLENNLARVGTSSWNHPGLEKPYRTTLVDALMPVACRAQRRANFINMPGPPRLQSHIDHRIAQVHAVVGAVV